VAEPERSQLASEPRCERDNGADMGRIRVRTALICAVTCGAAFAAVVPVASAAPGRSALATSTATAICKSAKRPRFAAWLSRGLERAVHGRDSRLGLAVSDPRLDLTCALHQGWRFDAASTIKATIISALLLKQHGPSHLTKAQRSLAWLMITQSDNDAATDLWNEVGMRDMQRFLDKAGMKHTVLSEAWGLTQETAGDELRLLRLLAAPGKMLSTASRQYVLSLMAHVIPSQRWGVPDGAPSGVTVSVKNGWLPYPTSRNWHVNSLGVFRGHDISYQIAVLTSGNSSENYGIATIQAEARVINRDIAKG
jgi:beta-lactamase class A